MTDAFFASIVLAVIGVFMFAISFELRGAGLLLRLVSVLFIIPALARLWTMAIAG